MDRGMDVARRIAPLGLLTGLALAYFAPLVLHPGWTLYSDHSDLIALHVPWETFLARAWREDGSPPGWNPLQFAGLPFAHDIQAATHYPPHLAFPAFGEAAVGPTLSWLVVAHVVLAGWGMFAYARSTGLGRAASTVAGVGFMFAGKWTLHLTLAGHYAFAAFAWLPWVALGVDRAVRGRGLATAGWAGVALGLMAMATQPQLTLYAGLMLVPWTLILASETGGRRVANLGRWAGVGVFACLVGFGIASVQLLPTLEVLPMTSRGVSGIPESPSLSLRSLLRTFGPSPDGVKPVTSWEPRSGLGVVWVAAALIAPVVTSGRDRRRARWGLVLLGGLVFFAMGGAAFFQWVPAFRMFRQASRMFLIAAFPMAYLVALTTEGLLALPGPSAEARARARRIMAWGMGTGLAVLAASALAVGARNVRFHPYWPGLVVTVPLAWWLVGRGRGGTRWATAWGAVLVVDLVGQTWPYVRTRPLDEVLRPSGVARDVARLAGPLDRVLDRGLPDHQSSTPLGPAVATALGLNQVRGYNALDLVRTKDYIGLISAPTAVRQPYNGLTNGPIRHKRLLDLLGVRFLVQPGDRTVLRLDEPDPDLDPSWRRVATDPAPSAFTFAVGGVRTLPPYEVLENRDAFPRAFVVPTVASPLDIRDGAARALLSADLRRVAVVELTRRGEVLPDVGDGSGDFRPATVRSYRPDRVEVDAEGPGLLVLADPWFPGWVATVDGAEAEIYRADFLFRGVALPPGRHSVVFAFRPRSLRIGRALSLATAAGVVALTLLSLLRRRSGRKGRSPAG